MNPQGSNIFDCDYISSLIDDINQLTLDVNVQNPCVRLQQLVDKSFASIQANVTSIEYQIEALAPMIELLTLNPANLAQLIAFVQKMVQALLLPQLQPYLTYAAQVEKLVAAVADLTTAIENAAERIEAGCSITVPALSFTPPALPDFGVAPIWTACELLD